MQRMAAVVITGQFQAMCILIDKSQERATAIDQATKPAPPS